MQSVALARFRNKWMWTLAAQTHRL
jgi:hypothetical protein